jgi:hypothetical protein
VVIKNTFGMLDSCSLADVNDCDCKVVGGLLDVEQKNKEEESIYCYIYNSTGAQKEGLLI